MSSRSVALSIVIVNWNSQAFLKNCLDSIFRSAQPMTFEVVVIDSGSFDGCDQMLAEHYPQVRFVQSRENLGFARANNCAFELSRGACVLFLNPDTEVIEGALGTLYAALGNLPDAGLVGCRLLNGDGTLQESCIQAIPTITNQVLGSAFLRRAWPRSKLWGMAPLHEGGDGVCEVEGISGACVMTRREVFEAVGRFTDEYFMYAEDMDLSYKVRRAGYRNYFVPQAAVVHHGGGSSDQAANTFTAVMMREAIWRFLRKSHGRVYGFGYRVSILASALGRLGLLGIGAMSGRRRAASAISRRKWMAILRWSVHRDRIVDLYYER